MDSSNPRLRMNAEGHLYDNHLFFEVTVAFSPSVQVFVVNHTVFV